METLAHLGRRVAAAEELEAVARMMKGVATVSLRRYEEGIRTLDEYEWVVEAGLQIALRGRRGRVVTGVVGAAAARAPVGLVAFGSSFGLCGPVNRNVAFEVRRRIESDRTTSVVAIGGRLGDELDLVGVTQVDQVVDAPSTIEGVTASVDEVLLWIDDHLGRDVDRIELIVPIPPERLETSGLEPSGTDTIVAVPTDPERLRRIAARPWPTNHLPMHRTDWPRLVAALTRELLFVGLHRAFVHTMAVVAESRSLAMDAAQRDVAERLEVLRTRHRRLRQSEITEELLDVVAGYETLVDRQW